MDKDAAVGAVVGAVVTAAAAFVVHKVQARKAEAAIEAAKQEGAWTNYTEGWYAGKQDMLDSWANYVEPSTKETQS